jgi:ABC-type lipoprotein export system ATPase subunit
VPIFAENHFPLLELEGIRHSYQKGTYLNFPALKVEKGSHVLLSGSSGSGKTTLLHIACGILKPSQGQVTFNGIDIYSLAAADMDKLRGQHFGITFQKAHLIKTLTVLENLLAAMYFAGNKPDKQKAIGILERLNLKNEMHKMPYALSQGQAQRAAVAKAVSNSPSIIFADEPSSSLDDENADAVIRILMEASENLNAALVVSSHDSRLKKHFRKIYNLETQSL